MRDVQRGAERNSWWQFSDLGEAGSEGRSRCAWDRGVSLQCKPLVLWATAFKKSGRGRGAKTDTQQQLAPHTQTKHNAHKVALWTTNRSNCFHTHAHARTATHAPLQLRRPLLLAAQQVRVAQQRLELLHLQATSNTLWSAAQHETAECTSKPSQCGPHELGEGLVDAGVRGVEDNPLLDEGGRNLLLEALQHQRDVLFLDLRNTPTTTPLRGPREGKRWRGRFEGWPSNGEPRGEERGASGHARPAA